MLQISVGANLYERRVDEGGEAMSWSKFRGGEDLQQ